MDLLEALVKKPALSAKIAGWVSMQGAVFGSPVADVVSESRNEHFIERLLTRFCGSENVLKTLRQDLRYAFIERNLSAIRSLTGNFRTISFGSVISQKDLRGPVRWLNKAFGSKMRNQAPDRNDGLIPAENSLIPYTDYVIMENLDHMNRNREEQPFPSLLVMLLEDLEKNSSRFR